MSKKRHHNKPRPQGRPPEAAQPVATPQSTDSTDAHAAAGDETGDDAALSTASALTGSDVPTDEAGPTHELIANAALAVAVAAVASPATSPTPSQSDIRGVLIQVAGARLLLPNATIAEVLSYADPEPIGAEAPEWLLGRMRWRGWQLPLIAFGKLAGVAEEKAVLGSKVVVLKALGGVGKTPYLAILTQGFPRLVTVSRAALAVQDDSDDAMPRGVQARVRLNEDQALLPDLEAVELLVSEALAQAAQAA